MRSQSSFIALLIALLGIAGVYYTPEHSIVIVIMAAAVSVSIIMATKFNQVDANTTSIESLQQDLSVQKELNKLKVELKEHKTRGTKK